MIATEDIHSVTENVFTTMIGYPVELTGKGDSLQNESAISGCVQISGEWTGAIIVQTTEQLATQAASKLLAIDTEDVALLDLQDAMAELANMIGGNIKSLVPGPSILSLPTVTTGEDYDIRVFGTQVESLTQMRCLGQDLRVVVCKGKY